MVPFSLLSVSQVSPIHISTNAGCFYFWVYVIGLGIKFRAPGIISKSLWFVFVILHRCADRHERLLGRVLGCTTSSGATKVSGEVPIQHQLYAGFKSLLYEHQISSLLLKGY